MISKQFARKQEHICCFHIFSLVQKFVATNVARTNFDIPIFLAMFSWSLTLNGFFFYLLFTQKFHILLFSSSTNWVFLSRHNG